MEFQQVLFVDYNSHLEEVEKASLDRRDTEWAEIVLLFV
jgi:hypothetical protein